MELPNKRYNIIYADPPWKRQAIKRKEQVIDLDIRENRRIEKHIYTKDGTIMNEVKNNIEYKVFEINQIDKDIHREINPIYLEKLEKIQKQQGIKFTTAEEFDAYFSE